MARPWALLRLVFCGGSLLPLVLASAAAQATPDLPAPKPALVLKPTPAAIPRPNLPPVEFATADLAHLDLSTTPLAPGPAVALEVAADAAPAIAPEVALETAPEAAPVAEADSLALELPAPAPSTAELPATELPAATSSPVELPTAEFPAAEPLTTESPAAELMPLVAATGMASPQPAADAVPLAQVRPAPDGDGWEYVLQPYLFVPLSIQSTVNVAGVEQSISTGLGDLFNFDRVLAGALRFEASDPQYGFFTDLSYVYVREGRSLANFPLPQVITDPLSLVSPVPVPPGTPASVTGTATSRMTTLDLGGFYRVVDRSLANNATYPRLLVDPLAGLRVIFLSGSLDFSNIAVGGVPLGGRSLSQSATLVQPLIGAQASLELSDRWAVGLRGDIAGFGIGADENLSWNLLLGTRYSFNSTLALQLAYRFTEFRYRQASTLGMAQSQNGFWVGLDIGL